MLTAALGSLNVMDADYFCCPNGHSMQTKSTTKERGSTSWRTRQPEVFHHHTITRLEVLLV